MHAADCRQHLDRSQVRRAFTLPEVALAMIVLALGITTAITALQRAFLNLDTARNLQVAAGILQCEFEKERLFSWTQVSDGTYQPTIDASFLRNPAVAGRFTLMRTLAAVPQRSGQVVQVTLTVRWRSYDGRSLTRSYTTYFCQGGLYNYLYQNS
jgi:prepilin-type N-terminal cleavage/methylation domain-containing protein